MLQHGELGPPGRVGEWLRARELPFVIHRVWEAPLPDPTAFEFVISLGSEKSVTNDSPSWIPGEIDLLREACGEQDCRRITQSTRDALFNDAVASYP